MLSTLNNLALKGYVKLRFTVTVVFHMLYINKNIIISLLLAFIHIYI